MPPPWLIRVDLSGPLAYWTVNPGQNVQLLSSPDGNFAQDGQLVPLGTYNYSDAINELQLFPASPLAPGYYEVVLTGQGSPGSVLTGMDGNSLESGQDVTIPFQVNGIEGRVGATTDDSTPATAQELGDADLGRARAGRRRDRRRPARRSVEPGGHVSFHRHAARGTIRSRPRSSPAASARALAPGVSLFRFDPADDSYQFIAGDINSYNTVTATDGYSTPLYTDSVLYASLTAGDYYLAVTDGTITPSPYEGQAPGSFGIFDPNQPGGFLNNYSPTHGPVRLESARPAGQQSPARRLDQPERRGDPHPGPDADIRHVRRADEHRATGPPDVLEQLPGLGLDDLRYRLGDLHRGRRRDRILPALRVLRRRDQYGHVSSCSTDFPTAITCSTSPAADGLTDLGGNQLVGNQPNGDYVVPFTVDAPARGDAGNPLEWSDQEPNDSSSDPQDLGVLFPNELAAGRHDHTRLQPGPRQAPQDTADVYEFQVLLNRSYSFVPDGRSAPRRGHFVADRSLGAKRGVRLAGRDADLRPAHSPGPIC